MTFIKIRFKQLKKDNGSILFIGHNTSAFIQEVMSYDSFLPYYTKIKYNNKTNLLSFIQKEYSYWRQFEF